MRIHMSKSCVLVGVVVFAQACSGSQQATVEHKPPIDVPGLLQIMVDRQAQVPPGEVTALLGAPVRVREAESRTTFEYYGLEVGFMSGRVGHVALVDARYTAPEGVRVGWAETQVLRLLGVPTRQARGVLEYEGVARLVLTVEQGVISRVEWRFAAQ